MTTGFLWHDSFARYDAGGYSAAFVEPLPSPDIPETRLRIRNLVAASGLLERLRILTPRQASRKALLLAHDEAYLNRLSVLSDGQGGEAGPFLHMPKDGLPIARMAAGAAIEAVDAVIEERVDNAYALLRPAGHHAGRGGGQGFCVFNNVAIAALQALDTHRLARVAIVDWDVHHGNGTQEIFWEDARVLTISIHQSGLYTLSGGGPEERGGPSAPGTNVNIPLPPGSGHEAYVAALEEIVIPAIEAFSPELILLASGVDALFRDPLGRMLLHSDSFREMTRMMMRAADATCGGRLAVMHEGGYSLSVAPFAGLAILEQLSGISTGVIDPFLAGAKKLHGQAISPDQTQAIAIARRSLEHVPANS